MDQSIQIIVPTFHRPQEITRLIRELERPLFVVHESDHETLEAVKFSGAEYVIDRQPATGVNASNRGYWAVTSDWFVLSQDDIVHHPGFLDEALRVAAESGASVVGLNDGATTWSVAWLIYRPYVVEHSLSIGHPNVIFNPDYTKNYADNELNETAKFRGVFAYSEKSLAEHIHPGFSKKGMDHTYRRLEEDVGKDAALYQFRRHLWT